MATVTVTKVASATSNTTLTAALNARQVIIENSDANRLHIRLDGGTASTTDFSVSLAQNASITLTGYAGAITGIWAADGTGYAHVTVLGN